MTVLSRAATLAAFACMLSGLLATSTPGAAAEIDRAVATPVQSAPSEVVEPAGLLSVPELPVDDATTAPEPRTFESLDAAVAAQDHAAADETLRCLAGAIYHEAKGEPLAGQLAVAEVVLNRAKSGRFPSDVCAVITQRGQFGFVRGGTIPSVNVGHAAWKRAVAVAKVALADAWNSPAANALYFNTRASFGPRVVRVASIGNHIFFR